jgi:hypothetical protein
MANPNPKNNLPPGPGPGRPKGSKDKFTRDIKEALLEAFNSPEIGGVQGLIKFGMQPRNQAKFFEFVMKLLPHKVEASGPDGGAIPIEAKITTDYDTLRGKLESVLNADPPS